MDKKVYLIESVASWLGEHGFHASNDRQGFAPFMPDLVVQRPSGPLLVEVIVANVYRSKVFPALVGDVILRAHHAGAVNILVAILLKRLNNKAIEDLERYAADYCPNLNWFLIDESGSGEACLDGQRSKLAVAAYSQDAPGQDHVSRRQGNLFSPNNQWLLKVLLLPGIDSRYWGGPYDYPRSIMELSRLSGISQPSVSSFVMRFEGAGYVKRKNGVPMVVRHRELLDDWFYAQKNSFRHEMPVRSLYGDSLDVLVKKIGVHYGSQQEPDVVIGYHMACHLHGIGRSSVKAAIAYAHAPAAKVLRDLDLVADESSSPSLWLINKCPLYVHRGSVLVDGIPVCDILQCYLDVRASRARGQEQADYILENILFPHFERKS